MEVNEARIAIYVDALKDIPGERIEAACQYCLKNCRFFPTIADIRQAAIGTEKDREDVDAELAWAQVAAYVRGGYWHPDQGHRAFWGEQAPVLPKRSLYALRQVGDFRRLWDCLGDEGADDFTWIHREFIAAWKMVPAQERQLPGELDDRTLLQRAGADALAERKKLQ